MPLLLLYIYFLFHFEPQAKKKNVFSIYTLLFSFKMTQEQLTKRRGPAVFIYFSLASTMCYIYIYICASFYYSTNDQKFPLTFPSNLFYSFFTFAAKVYLCLLFFLFFFFRFRRSYCFAEDSLFNRLSLPLRARYFIRVKPTISF